MYYIFYWCLVYPVMTATPPEDETVCSCDHTDYCDCSSKHLYTIPSTLPKQLKGLDLSNNLIQMITDTDLKMYPELKVLRLKHNQIHSISDNSFQSLTSLEDLDISYNNLTSLSVAWFIHLDTLKSLNLLGNHYTTLGENSLFSNLASLRFLQFGNPVFAVLRKQDFGGVLKLDELYLNIPRLQQYTGGTMKAVKDIGHINLAANVTLLPEIIHDLVYSVTLLEITNTSFQDSQEAECFAVLNDTSVRILKYTNCILTDASAARMIEIIYTQKNITDLILEDCVLQGTGHGSPILKHYNSSLSTVVIKNLYIPNFFLFSDLSFVYQLVYNIKSVTCIDSKVFLMPCHFSRSFKFLEYLDLSGNLLTDLFLESSACYFEGYGAWPSLQTLNVSRNLLSSLPKVSHVLAMVPTLTNIDLSKNSFGEIGLSSCKWPEKLIYLNLSDCQMTVINNCIPITLQLLDLNFNNLEEFVVNLPDLKELHISNNRLAKLPGEADLSSLVLLVISKNRVNDFYQSDLDLFPNLAKLDGSRNNYFCSCQFVDFIREHKKILLGWPTHYICDSPSVARGKQIEEVRLPILMCHKTLVVTLSCVFLILAIAIIVALCHFLHVIWYVKMTWAWLKAKRKPLKVPGQEICYDAFISFSERDSEWVENMMVPELENSNPPLRVCLHKRDFVPGKWIIDNIMDAMEKSYKTLFILSEHFVHSEWCKYELEFSHFRLFDENNDTAILVLLEPIEKSTVPKRFYKLRKLMSTKTYLEWPTEEEEQQIFWFNLKSALKPEDYPNVQA
ncbi:toll-like receptor 2 [Mixophyes fleayi]|uniref:toll-like receptor 2 n=1 Tax=Mixophyes fleayi TaxID=3061075 RepID=UPI003F4DF9D9